ncbi:molecular chaperone HtpG [Inquilinus limosus]|uniref:Chaperone protein HtpG n=1 Tax=Inquilinus limosus MP06 TaxID=1398085 RepID=A0A0A0CZ71_9PROT|nr:molecular chaperone HtpG [Inquilinus limosus]KGM31125.1 heat shock protein 90 [Inquilinus limosus MP06]
MDQQKTDETLTFQAEVSRLLDIVAHSLYSQKEVFLRELISNASDACDRLRYAAITAPELSAGDADYRITLSVDPAARTLTIADNGIGMGREELVGNLGTIARSGTRAFVETLTGDAKKDVGLIGQFGVGFYSAFMVSREVEVFSRKAGEEQGWRWVSDGKGAFTVGAAGDVARGTRIVMHLSEGEDEFLSPLRLRQIVKTHSDHIAIPIVLVGEDGKTETLNRASALWTRPKSEITAEEYKEFYHHAAHAFDEPWLTAHWKAEGAIEYSSLLFVPSSQPFDLWEPERKHRVKLYVRRVFVTEAAEGLIPPYLRFLRGVIDSEDLPLNVSRELLQSNPTVAKIRQGVTKKILAELGRKAKDDAESYGTFWTAFGAVLKEGIYEDREQRDALLPLLRFRSTKGDGLVSLEDYVGRMRPGQEEIWYITGDDAAALARSPQLEGFRARDVEVLLLTDPVDEFAVPSLNEFQGKPFKSATRGGADLSKIETPDDAPKPEAGEGMDELVAALKLALADQVKDVRASQRLTDSAVCLVADEGDTDLHLERLLKQHRRVDTASKRILEVNPGHPLIRRLVERAAAKDPALEDCAFLLLDQARIIEGEPLPDPAAFSRRLSEALVRGLAA